MMKCQKRPTLPINALVNWSTLVGTAIIMLLLTPFLIKHLGRNGFGIWTLISSILGYYGILDLGITSAIKRYIARYIGQENQRALNETTSTAFIIFCVLGFFLIIVSFAIATPLSKYFSVPIQQIENFKNLIWILGLAAGIGFPGNFFNAVIRSHERFVVANLVVIIMTLLRTFLIIVFLSCGLGLLGVAYSYLIEAVFKLFLNFLTCKHLFTNIGFKFRFAQWEVAHTLVTFGLSTTVLEIANIMRFQLDSVIIGRYINFSSVAVYGVSALIIRFFLQFIATGTQAVLTPRFSLLDGKGEKAQLQQLFLKSLSITAFISFAIGSVLICFGKQIIVLWVGKEFISAVPILIILASSYTIALAQSTGIGLMYALKKHHYFAGASLIEGIANVALSIYLAPRYGIIGVAIGTAVPMLLIKIFLQPIYVSKIIGIPLMSYWKELLPAFIVAFVVVIAVRYTRTLISFGNEYFLVAAFSIFCAIIFFLAYLLIQQIPRKNYI